MKRRIIPKICAVLGLLSALFYFCPQEALATVHLYRKAFVITNPNAALASYQVKVTVDTATEITASRMNSAGDDIRFSRSTSYDDSTWAGAGNPTLNYWINNSTFNNTSTAFINSTATEIWVNVDSIAATGTTTTIYMYYGGGAAAGSTTNTFDFYDNFANSTKWATNSATAVYQAGVTASTPNYAYCKTIGENTTGTKSYTYATTAALKAGYAGRMGIRYKYGRTTATTALAGYIGVNSGTKILQAVSTAAGNVTLNSGSAAITNTSWSTIGTDTLKINTTVDAYSNTGYNMEGRLADVFVYKAEPTPPTVANAPRVLSVSSTLADGSYKASQVVPITVTFDQAATVTGPPQLTLTTGTPATTAVNYSSGTGTTVLTFNYTVAAGNTSADLDYAATTSLALNGGTIVGTTGSAAADLPLPSPGATGSLGYNKALVIDTTVPSAPSTSDLLAGDDTGSSNADDITSQTTLLSFTGTKENNGSLQLYDGAGTVGSLDTAAGTAYAVNDVSLAAGTHSITAKVTDAAGNVSAASAALSVNVDTSGPDAYINTVTEGTNPQYQYQTGTTLYYNSGYTGNFTVSAAPTDANSGIWKVNFPALGTGFSGDGDDTTSVYSTTYSWTTAATSSPGAQNTTAYNVAAVTTTSPFTVTKDAAAPTDGSLTYTDSGSGATGTVYAAASVPITFVNGTDAASGIGSRVIQRAVATFADDTEGTFGSFATLADAGATNPAASPYTDSTVTKGNAYKYQYLVTDNVGNAATWTTSNIARFGIKVTAPNGGETWTYSELTSITWTATDTIANVKIKLYKGGVLHRTLIASTPNDGQWSYSVGAQSEDISSTCTIRIEDAANTAIYDSSNANFAVKGKLTITSPTTVVEWTMGTSQPIDWVFSGGVDNVKITYSTDSGVTYPNTIVATTPNTMTYSWTVPLDPSATARVKVANAADDTSFDVSDVDFIIKGVKLTAPNTAVTWTVGTSYDLTWTYAGTIANVKLEYSTDGGTNYNSIISSTPTSGLSYAWTIPGDALGGTLKIRVADASAPTVIKDASDSNFTINGVRILSPDGAETWTVGTQYPITWTTLGLTGNIKLEYSTDGGTNYTTIVASTADDGSYDWTVPGEAIGSQLRIRASSVTTSSILDVSSSNFAIEGLKLVTPNGGGTWNAGAAYDITWSTQGTITPIKLDYSLDGGVTYAGSITASTANTGTFAWTVPLEAISNQSRIRISSVDTSTIADTSDADLTIKGVKLTAPNTAVTWTVSSQQDITWTYAGTIPNVKLEYYTGTVWTTVAESEGTVNDGVVVNDGAFTWTIPNAIGTTRKVKVSDSSDSLLTDPSDVDFTIKGILTITSPNDPSTFWVVGDSQPITWDTTGTINNVKLDYSTDSGATYAYPIISSVLNTGTYDWTIPATSTTTAKVRVSDVNGLAIEDASDVDFQISGISVTSPNNGSEIWTVGTSQNITWTWSGWGSGDPLTASFALHYSTDSGSNWTQITANTGAVAGTYAWTVPDALGTQTQVRVSKFGASTTNDVSDNNFTISAPLITGATIAAPSGVNGLFVGDLASITWTFVGKLKGLTEISYSTDGAIWTVCTGASGLTNTLTAFNWTIPADAVSTNATRVRIKDLDAGRSASTGTSSNYTVATPTVTISAPTAGTYWTFGGANQNITWTTNTNTANVRLSYSKDGVNYKKMTDGTAGYTTAVNSGTYSWTIRDDIGSATIKIVDDARPTISATANLDIVGSVALTAPSASGIGLVAGDSYEVTWVPTGTFTPVRLQFYNGSAWVNMNNTVSPNDYTEVTNNGSYSWVVPNAPTASAKVRVYDANTDYAARVIATSTNAFEIGGTPTLTLSAPVNTPSWRVGSSTNAISWTASSNVNDNIEVAYLLPDGVTWSVIDNTGHKLKNDSITWTVPQGALSATSASWTTQIRVRDMTRVGTAMTNAPTVVILPPSISVGSMTSVLTVGKNEAITWTTAGDIGANNAGNVRLIYSTNGTNFKHPVTGVAYNASNSATYVTAAASSGSYTWAVPDDATSGSTCVFKVIDDTRPAVVSALSDTFRIIHGAATVVTPSGGETWLTGETDRAIDWTYLGNIGNIKLEYSTNNSTWTVISGASSLSPSLGGTAWNVNAADTAGSGTYDWPAVPDNISDTVKIKITATDSTLATSGTSATNFKIKGSFTAPNPPASGVSWTLGDTNTVTWTTTGSVANVKIKYTTNGLDASPTWTVVASSVVNNPTGTATSYSWAIPTNIVPTVTATAKIRVEDALDSTVSKDSAAFKLIGKFTEVTVPAEVIVGVASTISWTTTGSIATKRLTYSLDGTNWRNMAGVLTTDQAYTATTVSGDSYSWTVPDTINNTTECLVRVADNADAANVYANSNTYKIKGRLSAVTPGSAASESYTIGTTTAVNWSTQGSAIDTVYLQYTTNGTDWKNMAGGIDPVATSVTASSYTWTVPDNISATAKVKVYDPRNSDVNATSANNFSIKGTLAIVAPNGTEVWPIGSSQNITWSVTAGSASITNIKLQYSTTGLSNTANNWKDMVNMVGGSATTAPSSGASGAYAWTVPEDYSSTSRVRIYEENSLSNTDNSDNNFEIGVPVYTVLQPGATNDWLGANGITKGDTATILWTTTGKNENPVKLEYSTDNFVSGSKTWTIAASSINDGSFETFNPQSNCSTLSACAKIRVTEVGVTGRPAAANISSLFNLNDTATITVSGPASAATWIAGKNYDITWAQTGFVNDALTLAYSLDSGTTWNNITTTAPNTGIYSWTLSDFHTLPPTYYSDQATAMIKVRDEAKQLEGVTAWTFTLAIPTITLSQPNGGEVWAVGDVAPVTWTYNGSIIGPLALQYDTSGSIGAGVTTVSSNISKTATFNWTVPSAAVSSTVKFRIKDTARPNSSDDSDTTVNIIASPLITVTAPTNASEQVVGGSTLVSWTIRGLAVSEVKLDCWNDADLDNAVDGGETVYVITSSNISRGTSDTASAYSGQYTGSATWAVPTSVVFGNNYKVRVRGYKADGTTLVATAVSGGHFRVKGGYEFRDETDSSIALSASTDWKAKSTHNIKWLNKGSSPTVKLEYQTATTENGLSSALWTTINAVHSNVPDANSLSTYAWIVPDPNLSLYPTQPPAQYYVKLRITDTSDATITETSNAFKISYYTVTWKVNDYDYGTALENLTVSATGGGTTYWTVASDALLFDSGTKVFTRRYPYSTISTSWAKEGYIGRTDSERLINADLSATQLLESVLSSQQQFKTWASFSYNDDTDVLAINCWLEKKGTLVLGTDPDLGVPSGAYVIVFDTVNSVQTPVATLTSATADANGSFWFTRANATVARASGGLGLVSGRTYFTKIGVWYRSREYSSGNSFEISIAKKLKESVETIKTEVTGVKSAVSTEGASTRAKVATESSAVQSKVTTEAASTRTDVAAVKTETASILTATGTESLPTKITEVKTEVVEQVKPHVKSAILNRETSAKQGAKITIRYRTDTGLTPTLNVYSPKDVLLVSSKSMSEVSTTGIYEYTVTFLNSWGKGDFTVICSEATQGTVDAIVITVQDASLEDVSSSVAAVLGATSGVGKLKDVADTLNTQFSVIDKLLTDISKNISTGAAGAGGARGEVIRVQGRVTGDLRQQLGSRGGGKDLGTVFTQLSEISNAIKKMGGTKGVNLEKLYDVSKDKKEDMNYLKNKAEELKATMSLNQKMLENVAKKPVVQTWFEFK